MSTRYGFLQLLLAHLPTSSAILCFALHVLLILIYIALVVVAAGRYEYGFSMPLSSSGEVTLSLIISVIAQTFGTLYLAGLVVVTQRLALVKNLHTQQTFTAIHDKAGAWLGLGSALSTLKDQIRTPAAIKGVALITLYLGGVAVLHIAIPASFGVNIYNGTTTMTLTTQLARPSNLTLDDMDYNVLSVYDELAHVGLLDNMIYDVLPAVPSAYGNTTVNATLFTARCGALPNATEQELGRDPIGGEYWWLFDIGYDIDFIHFPVPIWGALATSSAAGRSATGTIDTSTTIVVASTAPIVDASGSDTIPVQIHPVVQVDQSETLISSLYMLACDIFSQNTTIEVWANSRSPVESPPPTANGTLWRNWSPDDPPSDPLLFNIAEISDDSPPSSHWPGYEPATLINRLPSDNVDTTNNSASTTPSMLDVFLMEDLGMFEVDNPPVTLADFQQSLGKAVAAVIWYQRNMNYSTLYTDQTDSGNPYATLLGEATIQMNTLRMRLQFNMLPLAIGLGVSCMLFVLASGMISERGRDKHLSYDIDKAGVLQLTWLVGNEPHLKGITEPAEADLRDAGMFEVDIGDVLRQRARWHRGDDTEIELVVAKSHHV